MAKQEHFPINIHMIVSDLLSRSVNGDHDGILFLSTPRLAGKANDYFIWNRV